VGRLAVYKTQYRTYVIARCF